MVFFHLIKAHSIEGVDEGGVGLAIDLGERDCLEIQVLHGIGIKEEFAAVMGGKKFAFLLLGNNRCDLREVADENDLDSPEWLAPFRSQAGWRCCCVRLFQELRDGRTISKNGGKASTNAI